MAVLVGTDSADALPGGDGPDFIHARGGDDRAAGGSGIEAARRADLGDLLLGGAGEDTIDGGAGDDRLVGSFGNDTLAGGPGADLFVFGFGEVSLSPDTGQGEGNRDVVADFRSGVDLLDVTGYRSPSVTWAYDEAGNRTIVTIVDPRSQFGFPNLEIELAGVRDLTADGILV